MLRVLVIGGGGALARQVTERLSRAGYDATRMGREDLDVLDRRASRRTIHRMRPDVLVDCTMGDPDRAALVRGAGHVALAAGEIEAYGLYMSSVEVFDGQSGLPYLESDTPRPATPLGAAQLRAEQAVAQRNHRHAIVRCGALFGQGEGGLAEALLAAAAQAETVEADTATRLAPTYSVHLADIVTGLVQRHGYGVFHVPAGGACTELQFARALLRIAGSQARAVPADSGAGTGPGRSMTLASCRGVAACPDWRIALQAFIGATRSAAEEPKGTRT